MSTTTAPKKIARKVARKTAAPAKSATKAAPKKVAAAPRKKAAVSSRFEMGDYGYVKGSDSDLIAAAMVEGGADRQDIAKRLGKTIGKKQTRNGTEKNIPALMSSVAFHLRKRGYKVESTFRMVPPAPRKRSVKA